MSFVRKIKETFSGRGEKKKGGSSMICKVCGQVIEGEVEFVTGNAEPLCSQECYLKEQGE